LVLPMIVPPLKGRGMQNDQVPSEFWRVMVTEQGLRTRHVCPGSLYQQLYLKLEEMELGSYLE
jgi:hypothetical protein